MDELVSKITLPYLTNDQILENVREYRIKKDTTCLDRIVNNFIKLLIKKARKYKKPGIDVGDLIHYGIEGLIEAIDNSFNLTANEKFITYITIIIERRMKDGLDDQRGAVMFPKNIKTQQRKIRHEHFEKLDSPPPVNEESDPQEDLPNEMVYSKLNIEDFCEFKNILALEQVDIFDTSIEVKLDEESLQFDIFHVLEALLTSIEKDVIIHSFGLNGESAKAFDAIGLMLGVSSQKVRKIRNLALSKIRSNPNGVLVLKKYYD
jgi:RNA polymerase sigma factor (sigma-70 family)